MKNIQMCECYVKDKNAFKQSQGSLGHVEQIRNKPDQIRSDKGLPRLLLKCISQAVNYSFFPIVSYIFSEFSYIFEPSCISYISYTLDIFPRFFSKKATGIGT